MIWEGVWLRHLLAEGGIRPEATYVWSDGADAGRFQGEAVPFFRKDLSLGPVPKLPNRLLMELHMGLQPDFKYHMLWW